MNWFNERLTWSRDLKYCNLPSERTYNSHTCICVIKYIYIYIYIIIYISKHISYVFSRVAYTLFLINCLVFGHLNFMVIKCPIFCIAFFVSYLLAFPPFIPLFITLSLLKISVIGKHLWLSIWFGWGDFFLQKIALLW